MRVHVSLLVPLLAAAPVWAQPLAISSPDPERDGLFGYALSAVPDADGDGHRDFLIGAPLENGGASDAGRAHLYSGATGELLRTLQSPNAQGFGRFGYAVAGVLDADGDGRGDLLVSAYGEGLNVGRAYLFSGATGALLRSFVSPNIPNSGGFGCAVAGVEDADGDGAGDLLVGARIEDVGGLAGAGRAYLFSGQTGDHLHTLESPHPDFAGGFGCAVAGVEDADGDGAGDLLVGASGEDGGAAEDGGGAYLYSGATGGLLLTLQSPDPRGGGSLGTSVAGAADADGDGRGDLLVGAPGEGAGRAGRAHLYSGATGALLRTFEAPEPFSGFGYAVAALPDVDGDSREDFGIGAPGESLDGVAEAGRAYVYSGATGTRLYALRSPNAGRFGYFGWAGGGLGDVDGDGRGDGVVAADQEGVGGSAGAGRVYLYRTGQAGGSWVAEEAAVAELSGGEGAPAALALVASPNPFADRAALTLSLPEAAEVRVEVLDALGRRVAALHDGPLAAGRHALPFDGQRLTPGVYVARASVGGETVSVRLARR